MKKAEITGILKDAGWVRLLYPKGHRLDFTEFGNGRDSAYLQSPVNESILFNEHKSTFEILNPAGKTWQDSPLGATSNIIKIGSVEAGDWVFVNDTLECLDGLIKVKVK